MVTFYENPKIYTFSGFVYNTILDNWPLIENANKLGDCATQIDSGALPNTQHLPNTAPYHQSLRDWNYVHRYIGNILPQKQNIKQMPGSKHHHCLPHCSSSLLFENICKVRAAVCIIFSNSGVQILLK